MHDTTVDIIIRCHSTASNELFSETLFRDVYLRNWIHQRPKCPKSSRLVSP